MTKEPQTEVVTSYNPQPIDTHTIVLPPMLDALAEKLAQSVHDHWSRQRFAAGWVYGPERNDTKRQHPGLVPYDQLDEAEKEYDRVSAIETLRAIIALGFRIEGVEKALQKDLLCENS